MTDHLKITQEGNALVIALNRPKAINALTPAMMAGIADALERAQFDPDIKLVLLEGIGEKGFCAGGDVRHVRQMILDGQTADAFAFFELEYSVNRTISQFDKPIVSLMHGFTMGGGIGLGSHARYRFATQSARFAMPESAIGFFADVGARMLLAEADFGAALLFLLRGDPHSAEDAQALNLCDIILPDEELSALREMVIGAAASEDPDIALVEISQAVEQGSEKPHSQTFDAEAFCTREAREIVGDFNDPERMEKWLNDQALAQLICSRCPSTHLISIYSLLAAIEQAEHEHYVEKLFAQDVELAKLVSVRPDFAEGVRAVLVDKDHAPKWDRHEQTPELAMFVGQVKESLGFKKNN